MRWCMLTLLVVSYCLQLVVGLRATDSCSNVIQSYSRLGYPTSSLPYTPVSGSSLEICNKDMTCCTREMEWNLAQLSRRNFAQQLADKTEFGRTSLITATANFNDFFFILIEKAQAQLHTMFSEAYGPLYKNNKDVFEQMFSNFQRYYAKGDVNLNDAMDQFFEGVFKRMLVLQNPEFRFDDDYLKCAENQMINLKPFGETPDLLKKNLRQAFVAARTFVQGLAVGRNVALKIAQVEPTEQCSTAYTKMTSCPLCQGLTSIKPCYGYCMNVMQGCLAYHTELQTTWNGYIDAMMELGDRIQGGGSFNIEAVIDPLKSMISTAIMDYHLGNAPIDERLFSLNGCGPPPKHTDKLRFKRGARKGRKKNKNKDKDGGSLVSGNSGTTSDSTREVSLTSLMRDVKSKLRKLKNVWTELPSDMCSPSIADDKQSTQCWNGLASGVYSKTLMGVGLQANKNNPEVTISLRHPNRLIQEQIDELEKAAKHLNNAKLGINVDWLDLDATKTLIAPQPERLPAETSATPVKELPIRHHSSEIIRLSGGNDDDEGSGSIPVTNPDDTEDGDDKEPTGNNQQEIGSGNPWNSTIVKITPIQAKPWKPSGGKNRPNIDDEEEEDELGSGVESSNQNKPYLVPVRGNNNNQNSNNPYKNDNKNPFEMEGSGLPDATRYGDNEDDEDSRIKPAFSPAETKIVHTNSDSNTNKIVGSNDLAGSTTPKSSASSFRHTDFNLILLISCSLVYVFNSLSTIL